MKKLFVLFLLVMSALVVSTIFSTAYGQKSKIYSGDKSAREIKKSRQIYLDQIADYRDQVKELNKQNERLLIRSNTNNNLLTERCYAKINQNDSMISLCNKRISFLEEQANQFVAIAAGKDVQNYADLRGKPMEVANANLLVAYANTMSNGKSSGMSAIDMDKNDDTSLRGIVVNEWYRPVLAKITGPGGFYREFSLPARGGKATFKVPFPGNYTTVFQSSYESRVVTKVVSFNTIYNYDGQDYDYMATLFRGY